LTYGLRGNIYRSIDRGATWTQIETESRVLLMHGLRQSNGRIILAGMNGQFLISQDGGRSFTTWVVPVQGASALLECPDGSIIAVGLNGATRLFLPNPQSKEAS
jgi:photosystem II stability/assembly factor-like uncharacterized protein